MILYEHHCMWKNLGKAQQSFVQVTVVWAAAAGWSLVTNVLGAQGPGGKFGVGDLWWYPVKGI